MDIKQKQAAYHDWEAQTYEEKFSISYDERCIDYARRPLPQGRPRGCRLRSGARGRGGHRVLPINLALGAASRARARRDRHLAGDARGLCRATARSTGWRSRPARATPRRCPTTTTASTWSSGTPSSTTCPVPGKAIQEMFRVLKPGGTLVIAGEPTELGDRISHLVKRNTWRAFRAVTALPGLTGLRKPSITESGTPRTPTSCSPARGRGRPAHLPAQGRRAHGRARGLHRGRGRHRGADRELVRLGGAHDRGRRSSRGCSAPGGRSAPSTTTSG
jgi:hypothetical protein